MAMPAVLADCGRFADLLDALADGELPGDVAAQVDGHLSACQACAGELAATRALRAELAELREERAPEELRRRARGAARRAACHPAAPARARGRRGGRRRPCTRP